MKRVYRGALCCLLIATLAIPTPAGATDTVVTATILLLTYDVSVYALTPIGCKVSWATNGRSTSQVVYDTIPHEKWDEYRFSTTLDLRKVSVHRVSLSALISGKTYHFRVVSTVEGLTAASEDCSFTTRTRGRSPWWMWIWLDW